MTTASDARGGVLALGGVAFMLMAVAAAYLWHDRGEPETAVAAAAPEKPLKVYFGGCHEVHEGPVCMLSGTATITLWMEDPGYEPVVLVDGQKAVTRGAPIDGGVRVRVAVSSSARRLTIEPDRWNLPIESARHFPAVDRIQAERIARPAHALAQAVRAKDIARDSHERAELASMTARLHYDLRNREWKDDILQSIELHRVNGCLTGMARDLAFASHRLRDNGDIAGSRDSLRLLDDVARKAPEYKLAHAYFDAMLKNQTGDTRAALDALDHLNLWSYRLADQTYHEASIYLTLLLMSFLSRSSETQLLLERLSAQVANTREPCAKARLLNNLAWFGRGVDVDRSVRAAMESAQIYSASCPNAEGDVLLRLTLGRLYLQKGDAESVQSTLASLARYSRTEISARNQIEIDDLRAHLAALNGDGNRALRLFDSVRRRTGIHYEAKLHWSALVGIAAAYLRDGQTSLAVETLQEAERLVDLLVLSIPLGEGRTSFTDEMGRSSEMLVEVHLDDGDLDAAMRTAAASIRRASSALALAARVSALPADIRGRFRDRLESYRADRQQLASIVRDAWRLPTTQRRRMEHRRLRLEAKLTRHLDAMVSMAELDWRQDERPLETTSGELVLYPTADGFVALLRLFGGLEWTKISGDLETNLRDWLALSLNLRGGELHRLFVLSHPKLLQIPVDRLVSQLSPSPVVTAYSAGLLQAHRPKRPKRALVVGDPDGTLPQSRSEIEVVRRQLTAKRWMVDVVVGDDARRETILASLSDVRYGLFHFAGHSASRGVSGWESYLRTADSDSITVADIFALESVPPVVVLSSCEGGGDGFSPVGIAQAMIARGAVVVIAATRDVEDGYARKLATELYRPEGELRVDVRL
ncbi:MAG: CHAT domain-containing protein, partial [Deltaproteobacteria bacterium]